MSGKKYRLAIIGCGMICNAAHMPSINELRREGLVEVAAVADIPEIAARETAQRWEIPRWYTDPQKMLEEIKPDWVSVCTPNVSHKQWSIAALKAGANVMCEKPIALTWRDAKEMFDTADRAGKLLWACQSRRWSADMDFAYKAMRAEFLGQDASIEEVLEGKELILQLNADGTGSLTTGEDVSTGTWSEVSGGIKLQGDGFNMKIDDKGDFLETTVLGVTIQLEKQ